MSEAPRTLPEVRRTRPRDRRQTIANIARDLFAERGFSAVRMEDIASATGVTPRAVYRHYENKQQLLTRIVFDSQQLFIDAISMAESELSSPEDDLTQVLERLAGASLASPHFAVLWQREARHISPGDLKMIRERLTAMATRLASRIGREMTGINEDQAEIRAWAALAIISSPGHSERSPMATASQEALLSLAKAAIAAPPADPGVTEVSVSPPIPWSRREQLFAIAAELFAREGYLAVGINDIGAQAGIAGPSIYRYFTAKAGILSALVNRFCEWATLETARALSCSKDRPAADVVRELAAGYIRLCVEWTDLASVMVTEVINLDPDEARLVERIRSDLESVWVDQVVRARPELEHATAERLVKVAMVMIEDTVRVHHLRTKPGFVGELLALAVGVLVGAPVGHVVAH